MLIKAIKNSLCLAGDSRGQESLSVLSAPSPAQWPAAEPGCAWHSSAVSIVQGLSLEEENLQDR